ncbi:LysR family transcriptional regulator [Shinella sp. DD12]|uniref:LysR family transcriptional regulator n=1 Tax=Shinella sp. DD12 TaxID=1410620 RepID=UPI000437CB26|nr:LysR family transcriptional regulator [Shinella sp. DD12]EYR77461.1 transcriptional regulator [Shinella sp. DD12]
MDKFRMVKTFIAVAEAGSLSAAARSLSEPLTNVSRQMAQLERYLGFTLVNRTSRVAVLTPEGQDYLLAARNALDELEYTEARISERVKGHSGNLVITAPVTLGRSHVLPVLNDFLRLFPKVTARVEFLDRSMDLVEDGIDLAIRVGKLGDSGLLAVNVGNLRPVVCASPDYIERNGEPVSVAELANHDCVVFNGGFGDLRWTFRSSSLGANSVRLHPRLSVNAVEAAILSAEAGMGITRVLSYQAHPSVVEGRLVEVLPQFDDSQIPVHMLRLQRRQTRSLVDKFVDFAAPRLRARLSDVAQALSARQTIADS